MLEIVVWVVLALVCLVVVAFGGLWFLTKDVVDLATDLRNGEVKSVELVRIFWKHAQNASSGGEFEELNLIAAERFEAALLEAEKADKVLETWDGSRELPPLLGVPISVKECIGVEGMPRTGGIPQVAFGIPQDGVEGDDRRTELVEVMGKYLDARCIAEEDATVVARLKRAGAIVLLTTPTSEACMWWETSNPVYGRSRNPHDPFRTTGGSSGGEAGIVAFCGVPAGVGSDIGGSLRIPSAFNGVFTHKPSGGLVPGTGQLPFETTPLLCTGPISRSAKSLWPLLRIMAGKDSKDAACVGGGPGCLYQNTTPTPKTTSSQAPLFPGSLTCTADKVWKSFVPPAPVLLPSKLASLKGLNVFVTRQLPHPSSSHPFGPGQFVKSVQMLREPRGPLGAAVCEPGLRDATFRAAMALCKEPQVFDLPELYSAFDIWSARLAQDNAISPATFRNQISGDPDRERGRALCSSWVGWALLKVICCRFPYSIVFGGETSGDYESKYTLAPGCAHQQLDSANVSSSFPGTVHDLAALGLAFIEAAPRIFFPTQQKLDAQKAEDLSKRLTSILGENGVLILPPMPTVAPPHSLPLYWLMNAGYCMLFNAARCPVTICPMGRDPITSMPLSVAIVGAPGNDALTIAAAIQLEELGFVKAVSPFEEN